MPVDDTSSIALLSLGPETGRGSNRQTVAGASLLERQVDVALALGCSAIWLYAERPDDIAVKAQILAESAGARFRIIQRARTLLGSLRRQDRLLVLAEGLLPGDSQALRLLADDPVILTLPADPGVAAGFERLDMARCWAGGMILPGSVIERLEGLDEDIDPLPALLRAGRAARLREREIPEAMLADGRWSLAASRAPCVVDSERVAVGPWSGARWLSRRLGLWLVDRPRMTVATSAAGVAAAAGACAGLIGAWPVVSLLLAAAAGILLAGWAIARQERDPRVFSGRKPSRIGQVAPVFADPLGAAAAVAGLHTQFGWTSTSYIAGVTLASWLLAAMGTHRISGVFRDRALLWLAMAGGGLAGAWIGGAALASAAALATILLNLRNRPTITQV